MTKLTDHEQARALLQKYRDRQCSPEEEGLVRQWFEAMGNDTALPGEDKMNRSVDELLPRIMQAIHHERSRPRRFHLWRATAAAAIILTVGALIYLLLPPSYQTFTTAMGERREITLPDGTTVFLNAASELKITRSFSKERRDVWLSGEGFFSVKHNPQQPFIVHTGNLHTSVLGTSFDIQAYPGESIMQVVVRTGKVSVSRGDDLLAPGLTVNQALSYDMHSGRYDITQRNANHFTAWRNGELFFDEAPVSEIAAVLARHYDVDVRLTGPAPAGCRYTVKFIRQPLPQVLSVLASLTGITYSMNGRNIIINPQTCN